jgi:hypothetical protein
LAFAETQFGVVSASQLRALGASRDWIKNRLRRRQLRPLHRDIYAVGHSVLVPQGRWLAAALAVPRAALSHRTAAAIWRLDLSEHATPELTTAREARSRLGLILHRSRTLAPEDVVRWHGVQVTRIERTLVDLVDVSSADEAMRVTDGSIDRDRLAATLHRAGPRKAHSVLRPLLDDGPRTRSELERAFVRMARKHGLGRPRVQRVGRGPARRRPLARAAPRGRVRLTAMARDLGRPPKRSRPRREAPARRLRHAARHLDRGAPPAGAGRGADPALIPDTAPGH